MEVDLGDLIATLALGLSLYTIWRQHGLNENNKRLSGLLIEKEEAERLASKRADLSASFVKSGKSSYQLRIFNRGKGPARNVNIEAIEGGELIDHEFERGRFPYPTLDVQQSISLIASVFLGSPRTATVRLWWDDDAGGGEKVMTIDVF